MHFYTRVFVILIGVSCSAQDTADLCFCQLQGQIGDCGCNVDTVDYFNNVKIHPRLKSLLTTDYFRYYKVNLNLPCPFWEDDSQCAIRYCHVKPCADHDIPPAIKGYNDNRLDHDEPVVYKYSYDAQTSDCNSDIDSELGYLNTTISAASYKEFELWQVHDSTTHDFCDVRDDGEDAQYVDLTLNPERYTGYKGKSAHRVWHSIYMENCFLPPNSYGNHILSSRLNELCLEQRAFYRSISGLHASINIHLCANYLLQDSGLLGSEGKWGPNFVEFEKRFSPTSSGGEGPQWLRNLYFLYLLELRALHKAAPLLESIKFFTGHDAEDADMRSAVKDLLKVVREFPDHFDEKSMFSHGENAATLKKDFQDHFRNISRIMDCVGCDKCKLWGKLQIHGVGTALKILFSGLFDEHSPQLPPLRRGEIVALFNSFGRLSTSINSLEVFRESQKKHFESPLFR